MAIKNPAVKYWVKRYDNQITKPGEFKQRLNKSSADNELQAS